MFKINGEANVKLAEKVKSSGIPRFIYVSIHNYHEDGSLPKGLDAGDGENGWGYFRGKRFTEEKLKEIYQELPGKEGAGLPGTSEDGGFSYYVLRPSFISGTRILPSGTKIPVWLIAKPLQLVTSLLPQGFRRLPLIGAGLVPPVSAEDVAKVAVRLVVDPTKYDWAKKTHIVTVDMMLKS
jgi:nucleoside-diphosphate-sugar epimerase